MIAVIYSQKQVPDAHTLRELFPEKVDKGPRPCTHNYLPGL